MPCLINVIAIMTSNRTILLKYYKQKCFNVLNETMINSNKTGTSKVGAISKAQIAQKTLKKLEIFDFFLSENVA